MTLFDSDGLFEKCFRDDRENSARRAGRAIFIDERFMVALNLTTQMVKFVRHH